MSDIKECLTVWLDALVRDYAQAQWSNYRRALTTPQAREELLGCARVYCYEAGTTAMLHVYADTSMVTALTMPFLLHFDGTMHQGAVFCKTPARIVVKNPLGDIIATVDNVGY